MLIEDFITQIYCWVDDFILSEVKIRLRQRGKMPKLTDPEVITMEIAGEFLGHHNNKDIWLYFKNHWLSLFPLIGSRSQFAKQATNLCCLKQEILRSLFSKHKDKTIQIVDGFPLPVTHFKRVRNSRNFKGEADYGYCASKDETYFGFKGHILVTAEGQISGFNLSAANVSERDIAAELIQEKQCVLLGDKGYLGSELSQTLAEQGVLLFTPVRKKMKDPVTKKLRKKLNRIRRQVETTIGQLAEQFQIQTTKARNMFSLKNCIARKLISHCFGCMINKKNGHKASQLVQILN